MKKTVKEYLIYTGNHNTIEGILEYVNYFNRLNKKKIKFTVSNKLSNKFYGIVFIEDFGNTYEYIKIKCFLNRFKGKKILVLTEFFINNSFNNFLNIKLPLKKFLYENYFIFCFFIYLLKIIDNLFIKYLLQFFSKNFQNQALISNSYNYDYIFFYFRYLRFLKLYKKFDYFLTSHSKISYEKIPRDRIFILDYFFKIKINRLFKNKKIFFSGQLNLYRKKILQNFFLKNKYFSQKQIKGILETQSKKRSFFININPLNYNYSLYIPKFKFWKFSSPSRHIRDLRNGAIPVSISKLHDEYSMMILNIREFYKFEKVNKFKEIKSKYIRNLKNFLKNEKKKRKLIIDILSKN